MEKLAVIVILALLGLACSQTCDDFQNNPYTKTWMIAQGHDYGAHEYLNEGGYITGFFKVLIREVCAAAGINCRTVWGKYNNCWDSTAGSHSVGGQGLMGRWYDACTGWYTTIDRIHVFDFSMPFLKPPMAYFYKKKGTAFNPNDISGKKIGFVEGWASDEKCLARQDNLQGNFLPKDKAIYAADPLDLVNQVMNGEVDAGFTTDTTMEPYLDKVDKVSSRAISCMIAGNSIMTRKDNTLINYWNKGFMQLRNSGQLKKLCDQANQDHGSVGSVNCIDM